MAGDGNEKIGRRGRAAVVVLGDIGRSPRMQYHALSLSRQASLEVDIISYGGSIPHSAVVENRFIHIHKMRRWPKVPQGIPKIMYPFMLLIKPVVQFLMLIWFLCIKIPSPDVFIAQNPPSVPTLLAVKWASWLRSSSFIVDWHNFGYTLLGLSLGRNSLFVAIYRWFEKSYGHEADGALCVTKAMQHELAQNWGIKATVLYDQSPDFFHPTSLVEKHQLFCRLHDHLSQPQAVQDCVNARVQKEANDALTETLFTYQSDKHLFLKTNRPALVVSSTSWTPDEDFGILLEAAVMYDRRVSAILGEDDSTTGSALWNEIADGRQYLYPRLLFVIIGKGPAKAKYEEKMRRLRLRRVAFRTLWLTAEDYPLLLGSADLGVCLHTFIFWFGSSNEGGGHAWMWAACLCCFLFMMLFKGFPEESAALRTLKNSALKAGSSRWDSEWEEHAKPLISKVISQRRQ